MKKIITLVFVCFSFLLAEKANGQAAGIRITENSVVKDTTGTVLPFAIWNQLLATGRYNIKPESPTDQNTAFIVTRLSEAEYEKRLAAMPAPRESEYFRTGGWFTHFRTTDMEGKKINTKSLSGKIIVLNFWFINCPPCRTEIPGLNKLAAEYKNDSSVVFLAVALDQKADLKEFLKTHPFGYTIIDDGRSVASQYGIKGYPTNVVVSPEGRVQFHSTGYAINTIPYIKKIVLELKAKMKTAETASTN